MPFFGVIYALYLDMGLDLFVSLLGDRKQSPQFLVGDLYDCCAVYLVVFSS